MAVLGYLTKSKRSLGLALLQIFCMIFHKNVLYLICYQWTKFQCHTLFLSQDIACVRYFSLFLKDQRISSLVRLEYIEKKFNLQLFFLPTVS